MIPGRPAIVGLGLAIAVVAAFAVVATSLGRPTPHTEVGVVVSVESISLTEVLGFAIRTPDGRTVEFRVGQLENGREFPPGHLGEHQATAAPIRVTYLDQDGARVAIRLEDAEAAGSTAGPS